MTTTQSTAGEPKVLASYRCEEGERRLVAQRVNGTVALSDVAAGEEGRVHLVEREHHSLAELEAIVADYLELARRIGRCPMEGWL